MKTLVELKKESLYLPSNWSRDELYIFTEEQLMEFCEKLCEDQRKECCIEYNKDTMEDENGQIYIAVKDILSTEIPVL